MDMFTTVTENPENTKVILLRIAGNEINDGSTIVIMNVAVAGGTANGTGF